MDARDDVEFRNCGAVPEVRLRANGMCGGVGY